MVASTDIPPNYDRRDLSGPFDLIGDVHGCARELDSLLKRLGYRKQRAGRRVHPEGRTAVLLGDLVDRGPHSPTVIRTVSEMVQSGSALYVPGNHDERLMAYLMGNEVDTSHGLTQTIDQLENLDPASREDVIERFVQLYVHAPPYLWLDGGDLVGVHGGIEERMIGTFDSETWLFCMMGKLVEDGPWPHAVRRIDWARDYRGSAFVAYGHTPVRAAVVVNNTVNLDQGCVFGGSLSAFRYPEREVVSVRAVRPYFLPGLVP